MRWIVRTKKDCRSLRQQQKRPLQTAANFGRSAGAECKMAGCRGWSGWPVLRLPQGMQQPRNCRWLRRRWARVVRAPADEWAKLCSCWGQDTATQPTAANQPAAWKHLARANLELSPPTPIHHRHPTPTPAAIDRPPAPPSRNHRHRPRATDYSPFQSPLQLRAQAFKMTITDAW